MAGRKKKVKAGEPQAAPDPAAELPDLGDVEPKPKPKPKPEPDEPKPKRESTSEKKSREKRENEERKQAGELVKNVVLGACGYGTMRAQIAPMPDQLSVGLAESTVSLLDHYGLLLVTGHPAIMFGFCLFSASMYARNAPKLPVEDAVAYYGEAARKFYEPDMSPEPISDAEVEPDEAAG